ncbi:putative Flagellar export protein FliJ [Candidatus Zixiibacteriota bacterium]|nr:putative Flagellar export protein FliJ [candidate division Zixibacteria bacterium]
MKKFRFRLERVLQIKAHHERDKQKFLALASHRVMQQEQLLDNLIFSRTETQERQRNFLEGKIEPQVLSGYSRYYMILNKNELAGKEVLKAYLADREKKRLELVEATKQKKIYEKLRERKRAAHLKNAELTMQKEQDELASNLFNYKKGSRGYRKPSE